MFLLFVTLVSFFLLQLGASQFLVQFNKLHGIEPEVGVANVYVVAVAVRDDFYLLHFQLRLKLFVSAL